MKNFEFYNPTKIIFGESQIAALRQEIPQDEKVLILYGGGSIKKNGVYEQVMDALSDHHVGEYGGIPANPEYETLMKAVEVIRREGYTYLLAVGGGSVIDGTKFIALASRYDGDDAWQILKSRQYPETALPIATVLTLPATGSEMNYYAVVSRAETKEKLSLGSELVYPKVSILDPSVIKSVPERQLANGLADAYTHVLEQYMTYPAGAALQDRLAESVLQTIIEVSPKILSGNYDHSAASDFMWSCTMALNGLLSKGVPTDWAIHGMGHELTALHGIDHARTLAIIVGPHYRYNIARKKEKLAQYAERVWGILEGNIQDKAEGAIARTVAFYESLGIETRLSAYTDAYEGTAEEIERRFVERKWLGLGEHGDLSPADVRTIVAHSYGA